MRVFPEPAPAIIRRGPSVFDAAAACSGFRTAERSVFIQKMNFAYCGALVNLYVPIQLFINCSSVCSGKQLNLNAIMIKNALIKI